MKTRFITLIGVFACSLLFACSVEPQSINYGQDQCHFCKMTIVDKQHSAQYVTNKGKQFKFDAIECLVNQLGSVKEDQLAHILVANYEEPGAMIDARNSHYIICKKIKSPMGANLSAFSSKESAEKTISQFGGNLFNWTEIQKEIREN